MILVVKISPFNQRLQDSIFLFFKENFIDEMDEKNSLWGISSSYMPEEEENKMVIPTMFPT
jgi:hypothetical protein